LESLIILIFNKKVIVIGDSKVGKTSLLSFLLGIYQDSQKDTNAAVDIRIYDHEYEKIQYRIEFWEIDSSINNQKLVEHLACGSAAMIAVFDGKFPYPF